MQTSAGLVGLANVGKSTLFNAIVRGEVAKAANFPFCTIQPQSATVAVPDAKLDALAKCAGSEKQVPQTLEVHDIAGLIQGASKGEGLGNAFLGDIRAVSSVLQVVRCFDDPDVIHVMNTPDPVRDISIIENELILADLQSIEKRMASSKGKAAKTPEAALAQRLLEACQRLLEQGLPARLHEHRLQDTTERLYWPRLHLLSQKPVVYVCNVAEDEVAAAAAAFEGQATGSTGGAAANEMVRAVRNAVAARFEEFSKLTGAPPATAQLLSDSICVISAKLEAEASLLSDADRSEFLAAYGLKETGVQKILLQAARVLKLRNYYTVGPMEARSWSIPDGATAVEAAMAIHTDFGKGFVKAEICTVSDYLAHGGDKGSREANKWRTEGKEYVMGTEDIAVFKIR
jgi:hypothetical protein